MLAEYLVAQALGMAGGVREEWAAHDLTTLDGLRTEVRSAAYLQSWHQERLSAISFSVRKSRAWDRQSNHLSRELRRQAEVYVFALLAHRDMATVDPMDVSQWEFFTVPTAHLDGRTRSQHSITLASLIALAGAAVPYAQLRAAVEEAGRLQRRLTGEGTMVDRPITGS